MIIPSADRTRACLHSSRTHGYCTMYLIVMEMTLIEKFAKESPCFTSLKFLLLFCPFATSQMTCSEANISFQMRFLVHVHYFYVLCNIMQNCSFCNSKLCAIKNESSGNRRILLLRRKL